MSENLISADPVTLTVLEQTATSGRAMGVAKSWAPAATPVTIDGYLFPVDAKQQLILGARGMKATYKFYSSSAPPVDETKRFNFGSLVLRIIGIPYNAGEMGELWVTLLEASREDNLAATIE